MCAYNCYTVEPLNNGHSGDRPLVHYREVVPISEVTECMLQSVGGETVCLFYEGCLLLRVSIIRVSPLYSVCVASMCTITIRY